MKVEFEANDFMITWLMNHYQLRTLQALLSTIIEEKYSDCMADKAISSKIKEWRLK